MPADAPPPPRSTTGLALASALALAAVAIGLLAESGVHGALYGRIADAQDLIGDVEPPPLFVVEAMAAAQQAALAADPADALARLERLRGAYLDAASRWRGRLAADDRVRAMFASATPSADAFFAVARERLVPAAAAGDAAGMAAVVAGPLARAFADHRAAIDALMAGLRAERAIAERDARILVRWAGAAIAAFAVVALLAGRGLLTSRAAQRRDLRDREQRYRCLAQAAFEGVAVIEDGIVVDANPQLAALLGAPSLVALRGRPIAELIAPDHRARYLAALAAGGSPDLDLRLVRVDGVAIDAEVRPRLVDLDGRRVRIAAIRDVTERRRADDELARHRERLEELVAERTAELARAAADARRLQDEAERERGRAVDALADARRLEASYLRAKDEAESANRAKGDFLAGMSHEIRTPLNALLGHAQVLARDASLAPRHRGAIEVIGRSGEHLLALISDILEMSRLESGRAACHAIDFDLHELLTAQRSLFLLTAHDRGIELKLSIDAAVPRFVRGDERKLRQILFNLLANALKFTRAGRIDLAVRAVDGEIAIDVADTGAGMAADELDRLFQPFAQGDAGRRRGDGAGLGLALSRGFARLMGGELTATSRAGEGSVFTVRLPLAAAAEPPRPPATRRPLGLEPGTPPPRVLLAEDHRDSRELLVAVLREVGLDTRAVGDGAAAVDEVRAWRPQLVLMDLDMPVLDGLAAARRIRCEPGGASPGLRIVALTAAAFAEDRARILACGFDEIAHKPYREAELFALIERLLAVRFRWSDAGEAAVDPAAALVANLAALDRVERERARAAITLGDVAALDAQAAAWPHAAARDAVRALAAGFRFDRLLEALDEADRGPPAPPDSGVRSRP